MSALLEHTFSTSLDLSGEAVGAPVLVAESPCARKEDREKMTEVRGVTMRERGKRERGRTRSENIDTYVKET